jgi:hypothetical protein
MQVPSGTKEILPGCECGNEFVLGNTKVSNCSDLVEWVFSPISSTRIYGNSLQAGGSHYHSCYANKLKKAE